MRKLQVCQNKCLRMITGSDYTASTKDLLKSSNQLSVHQLVAFHSACQVYRIAASKLPVYHYDRLFKTDTGSNEASRTRGNKNRNKIIDFGLSLGKSNFFHQSSRIWASLPKEIQEAKSIKAFKSKCKIFITENVSIRP